MQSIRTMIVDDSQQFIDAAKTYLSSDPKIDIVGDALSGADALERIEELQPELVLMDLAMPEMNGLEATRRIKERSDPPYVIILTLHDHPDYRTASEGVRADGFLAKSEFGEQLMPLIESLFEANQVQAPSIA